MENNSFDEDLSQFGPKYSPETYSVQEKSFLKPFFSNCDLPVFAVYHLPEEVIGALSSRYSRSAKSLRRMFLDEYVGPIIFPEEQKDWPELTTQERREREQTRKQFLELVKFLNSHGGVEVVTNVQRARKFFDKWLAEYGDDSIAEMGTVHLCLEGVSQVALQEIEEKRIGVSFLEKSTRYVSFSNADYVTPGEIVGSDLEKDYRATMDFLFESYVSLAEPYFDYIAKLYPQGEDETPVSFKNSRSAKRFDDIRDLLPFATKTNVAISGNGRVYEDLVNRLMGNALGEIRWWGQAMARELAKVVPSFVTRATSERGTEAQKYRQNIKSLKKNLAGNLGLKSGGEVPENWVKLVNYSKYGEEKVLAAFLFSGEQGLSFEEILGEVEAMSSGERQRLFSQIFAERKLGRDDFIRQYDRFRKVPRALENASYLFEIWGRGGDYRDLHRHRMNTQERQIFGTAWGFDLEKEVMESPFVGKFVETMNASRTLYKKLENVSPEVAQYAVAFGFIQHWYMNLSGREIYWMVELRTGPQGRPFYRKICQEIARLATSASPNIFSGLLTDFGDYSLARRESEKKIEAKKVRLGV